MSDFYERFPDRKSASDKFTEARAAREPITPSSPGTPATKKSPTGRLMRGDEALEIANFKAASDASRKAGSPPDADTQPAAQTPVISIKSIQALIEFWQRHADNAKDFYESEFNYTSLVNCVVTLIFGPKQRPATVETVAEAYAECILGNHLELPRRVDGNGATIRKRGDYNPQPIPPTLYPAYIWPAEVKAASEAKLKMQLDTWLAEKKVAQQRPFTELQKEVRSGFRPPKADGPTTWS